jgi:hypothetical protein
MPDSVWKIQDKDWMKQRQERWKGIEKQLKRMVDRGSINNKEDIRYYKAYFLKGVVLPIDEKWGQQSFRFDKGRLGEPFEVRVFFKIWFYPTLDEALFRKWCEDAGTFDRYKYSISGLAADCEYEFFADRSIYLDQYLVPQTYQDVYELDKAACPYAKIWISEKRLLEMLLSRLRRGVIAYRNSVINAHMGYISDNFILCFAFPLFKDLLSINGILSSEFVEKLIFIMNSLVNNETPPESYAWGVATKLYRELTEFFESGVTPEVDALWQKAKLEKANNPS